MSKSTEAEYFDIKNWDAGANLSYFDELRELQRASSAGDTPSPQKDVHTLEVDSVKTYALLRSVAGIEPNGFYTFLGKQSGKMPMDNLIWWDFILNSSVGYIHVWRTNSALEAMTNVQIEGFNLNDFFSENINKYSNEISQTLAGFERHKLFINHYASYMRCIEFLWRELATVDVIPPNIHRHLIEEAESKQFHKELDFFTQNITKQHVLGKSLILQCAFAAEGLVHNLLRVAMSQNNDEYPEILANILRQRLRDKLSALNLYTGQLKARLDMSSKAVTDILKVVEIRNKYVHSDETSKHNQIGSLLFDGDFPVFPTEPHSYLVSDMLKTFGEPSKEKIRWAYESIHAFNTLIRTSLKNPQLWSLLEANPLGFNENKHIYSVIFPPNPAHFMTVVKPKK